MRQILIAVGIALTVSILLTPVLIRLFTRQGFGHEIREDGPPSHHKKRGTPSMGGVAIVAGIWAGYLGTQLIGIVMDGRGPSASGWLVLGLATALGAVGFVDDLIKIRRSRNLGLNKTAKTVGILTAAVLFGVLALQFRNADGLTPGSAELSYVREIATVTLAPAVVALFVAELTSVVVQIMASRTTGRRVFGMAPFHHHFELVGWAETTVIIRFWLLTAIACGLGVALFYSEWLTTVGA